eukprot:g36693.t1
MRKKMDRLCQVKEAGMRGRAGHGMRPGWGDFEAGEFYVEAIGLAQMFCESVTESVLGLTDVEETTSGATDTVDQFGGYPGRWVKGDVVQVAVGVDGFEIYASAETELETERCKKEMEVLEMVQ